LLQPESNAKGVIAEYSRTAFLAKVRHFEKRLLDNMRDVFVPVHLCLGQEEVAADLWENLRPEDWLFSTHRNHGHYLAKGGCEKKLWDEIMGLETGLNQGFSGSQGISDKSINFHASAIVGGLVGAAVGAAYALKMNKSPGIAVCCIGDGGTEAGVFWESLNFAALYKLPVAFICENNGMSVDAHISERQATPLGPRVEAFGVDVRRHVAAAIMSARANRPAFYEAKVKLEGHHIYMANLMPKEVIA
jgi:TPP-dependent pyruvate/acetoin dehydrogenase alpha subunit